MKVLWVGDAVVISGFSVVTHNICNHLSKLCDLSVFGTKHTGRLDHNCDYKIYPANNDIDVYGFKFIKSVVIDKKPDIVVLFNDIPIIRKYLEVLYGLEVNKVLLFPVRLLPLSVDDLLAFSAPEFGVRCALTYTEFSKNQVAKINPNLTTTAIYNGVNRNDFYPARDVKKNAGLSNTFVVGNVNFNLYRKRLDLFIKGFCEFAAGKPDTRCLVHTNDCNSAFNIKSLMSRYNMLDKLILSVSAQSIQSMNLIYNVIDVNCNTGLGEGFGASLLEGASCAVPILCPKQENLVDIWGDSADYIKLEESTVTIPETEYEGEVIDMKDFVSKLNRFYSDSEYRLNRGGEAFNHCNNARFDWQLIADKVFDSLLRANSGRVNIVS